MVCAKVLNMTFERFAQGIRLEKKRDVNSGEIKYNSKRSSIHQFIEKRVHVRPSPNSLSYTHSISLVSA